MRRMRLLIVVLWALLSLPPAMGQVSIGLSVPGLSIGINVPVFPELVRVPGYPVYYAPRMSANFFFYDGMYWVYQGDNWYASSWYNGPWGLVAPDCASPCAITAILPGTFADGGRTRRHAGESTGGTTGSSIEADGTGGTAGPLRYLRHCPSTSGGTRGIGIQRCRSSRRFMNATTAISRTSRW